MPLYTRYEAVRVRLIGKVRFSEDDADENKMQVALAKRLMNEAEGQVEQDLSPRYMAPFQTKEGTPYSQLPLRPTQEIVGTLCELQSVMRILETDFGRGTVADADKYCEKIRKRYDVIVDRILKRKDESYQNWVYPPLPGLRLAYFNTESDDGYSGTLIHLTSGVGAYAEGQINQPSQTFWNVTLDDLDKI